MPILRSTLLIAIAVFLLACEEETGPASPLKTFQTYAKAVKQKDLTTMKLLLSADSIKMLDQEAKSQGVTLDDVVKRETLFSEAVTAMSYRNEKIDGEKATLEIQNGKNWETIPFVLEDSQWKIDKKGYADRLIQDIQKQNDAIFGDSSNPPEQPF